MRVKALVGQQELVVLIDSGSTHNFISERVANTLGLPVVTTKPFMVKGADGNKLHCQGRYNDVPITIQRITFSLILYSLPLRGLDMVLGIQWLEMLGSVVCNWKQMTMEFEWEEKSLSSSDE